MKSENSLQIQPIKSLQIMLRSLMLTNHEPCRIIPDGVYGRETTAAVASFQKQHGLPATGNTDQETWDGIVQEYENATVEAAPLYPVQAQLPLHLRSDEESSCIQMAQCMLRALSKRFQCIPVLNITGCQDPDTCKCILAFQNICGLKPTGELNKMTWKHLVLQHSCACFHS